MVSGGDCCCCYYYYYVAETSLASPVDLAGRAQCEMPKMPSIYCESRPQNHLGTLYVRQLYFTPVSGSTGVERRHRQLFLLQEHLERPPSLELGEICVVGAGQS